MDADAPDPVVLEYPFRGRWQARNSPTRRIPSHGTHLFGVTYAIDFVGVDEHGRSGSITWRTVFSTEPAERFVGFGRPVLAPVAGTVLATHDGEPDHEARRFPFAALPYLLTQAERARRGAAGLAGNHVSIALTPSGPNVLLAHLRRGTVSVRPGDPVRAGQQVGECGNSGNSTEPHIHVQVIDTPQFNETAQGVPLAFHHHGHPDARVPAESEIITA